jgi:hypothetical protein
MDDFVVDDPAGGGCVVDNGNLPSFGMELQGEVQGGQPSRTRMGKSVRR